MTNIRGILWPVCRAIACLLALSLVMVFVNKGAAPFVYGAF